MDAGELRDRLVTGISNHTILAVVLFIVLLGFVGGLYGFIQGLQSTGMQQARAPVGSTSDLKRGMPAPDTESGGTGRSFVEVTEASFDIASQDADGTADRVRSTVDAFDGYVQESSREVSELHTTIRLTARVPDTNFSGFNKRLRERYDVTSYSITNYRVSTARTVDEIDIYQQTLDDLEAIRQEINQMETGEAKIDLLMKLTKEERDIQSRYQDYLRSLQQQQQRGDMATVHVTIEEERKVDLVPDDIGSRIRNQVKEMIDKVVSSLITMVTDGVEIFFFSLKLIVYLVMFLLPFVGAYRAGRWIYARFWTNSDDGTDSGDG